MGNRGQIDQVSLLFSHQNHIFAGAIGGFVHEGDCVTTWRALIDHIR